MSNLNLDEVNASLAALWARVKQIRVPPANVLTAIAPGRRELGWEVAYLALATANASANPVLGITVNNDADFVGVRAYLMQVGVTGAGIPIPSSAGITLQIRDSASGNVFFRQAGAWQGFLTEPYNPGSPSVQGRFVEASKGWAAPHILKKGSSAFFEISNPNNYTFVGDLYIVYEGYRLYPNQAEPVPATIKGQVEPFCWNGTLVVPNGLASGLQLLGTITMPGLDQNRYILKQGAIIATGTVLSKSGITLYPEDVLLMNVYDTYQQNKLWARVSNPAPYGQFMPAKAFVGGGPGAPWAWPRFMQGTDTLYAQLYGDPSAWTGGNPGTIEVQFNGVRIYG